MFLLCHVKRLWWEVAWCGVVVLDKCVLWVEVENTCGLIYVQNNYRCCVGG